MSERRELVAREIFALDADWRREYWLQFRRDFPLQAGVYYDTADRILAIVREDAMEVTQHTPADVRGRVARECVEEAERLGRWYGDGYAKARSLLREAAALILTPRGEGEAAAMSANLARALAAMQAAWIEWRRGRGADAAMQWIENTLIGPGLIPGDDESDAQAFFDRAIAEIENHQIRDAAALRSDADALELIRWAESRHAALEPVAGNIMPPGTYACYAGDGGEPYMGPGILGAIRAACRSEGGGDG